MMGARVNDQVKRQMDLQKNLPDELAFLDEKHRLNDPVKEHEWEKLYMSLNQLLPQLP